MAFPTYRYLLLTTWRQYLFHFDAVLLGNLLIALPWQVLVTLVGSTDFGITEQVAFSQWVQQVVVNPNFWWLMVLDIGGSLIMVFIEVMLARALQETYHQQLTNVPYLFGNAVRFYSRAVVLRCLTLLLTALGFLLLVVPGIVVGIYLSLALPVLVWEKCGPIKAVRRSIQLVRRQGWRVFGMILWTEVWLTLAVWLFISSMPGLTIFSIFGLLVASVVSSFQTMFLVIVYAACAHAEQNALVTTPTSSTVPPTSTPT